MQAIAETANFFNREGSMAQLRAEGDGYREAEEQFLGYERLHDESPSGTCFSTNLSRYVWCGRPIRRSVRVQALHFDSIYASHSTNCS